MLKLSRRSGISWSSHDGRRILQTALENVETPNNWIKIFKGRKVSGAESPYSQPMIKQLRTKYKEALPMLQFLTPTTRPETKTELEELKEKYAKLERMVQELLEKP
jgi:hypothetical protein